MKKTSISILLLIFLNACASSGMLNQTPFVNSPETATNVTIHRAVPHTVFFNNLVFTIDGVEIFGFDKGNNFKFVLNQGNYIFGYKYGFFSKSCSVDVELRARNNYVFSLEPDCVIELE